MVVISNNKKSYLKTSAKMIASKSWLQRASLRHKILGQCEPWKPCNLKCKGEKIWFQLTVYVSGIRDDLRNESVVREFTSSSTWSKIRSTSQLSSSSHLISPFSTTREKTNQIWITILFFKKKKSNLFIIQWE